MDERKVCSFFGHRDVEITEELSNAVNNLILQCIQAGCQIFYFGGFGDFDALCYKIVTKLKTENPTWDIARIYCVTQERYLRKNSPHFRREDYDDVQFLIPAFEGWYKSIYYRNCAMIDASDFVIFYAENREDSGAYKAYKYAKRKKDKQIFNLWK